MLAYLPAFMRQSSPLLGYACSLVPVDDTSNGLPLPTHHCRGWTLNTRLSTHTLPDQRTTGTQGAALQRRPSHKTKDVDCLAARGQPRSIQHIW